MTQPNKELATTEAHARGVPVALNGRQGDFDAAYRLAKNLAMSNLLPTAVRGKPADVLVTILYGQELGIAPMQALQTIYVVNGRPTLSAQLWVALARRAGHKVRVVEEAPESCTVEVERVDDPGHPTRVTYTLDQAKAAKLTGKDVWTGHRAAMLYARAVSTAVRRACPEVAMGFGDELDRVADQPVRPTLGEVAAQRADAVRVDQAAEPEPVQDPTQPDPDMLAELAAIERENGVPDDQERIDFGGEA